MDGSSRHRRQKRDSTERRTEDRYPVEADVEASEVAEAAAIYDPAPQPLQRPLSAARALLPEEIGLLEELGREKDASQRGQLAETLRESLRRVRRAAALDPFAELDEPMDASSRIAETAAADLEAELLRSELLRQAVDVLEVAETTGRSRQAIERLRRDGRLIALRVGRRYRYPTWQFDVDGPGGVLPGLDRILPALFLSPFGAALWLTTPKEALDGRTPVEHLRRRDTERVVALAEQHGYLA